MPPLSTQTDDIPVNFQPYCFFLTQIHLRVTLNWSRNNRVSYLPRFYYKTCSLFEGFWSGIEMRFPLYRYMPTEWRKMSAWMTNWCHKLSNLFRKQTQMQRKKTVDADRNQSFCSQQQRGQSNVCQYCHQRRSTRKIHWGYRRPKWYFPQIQMQCCIDTRDREAGSNSRCRKEPLYASVHVCTWEQIHLQLWA